MRLALDRRGRQRQRDRRAASASRERRSATGAGRATSRHRPIGPTAPLLAAASGRSASTPADYAELLGLYLGDGYISALPRTRAPSDLPRRPLHGRRRRGRSAAAAVLPGQPRRAAPRRRRSDGRRCASTTGISRACSPARRREEARPADRARALAGGSRRSPRPGPSSRAASARTAASSSIAPASTSTSRTASTTARATSASSSSAVPLASGLERAAAARRVRIYRRAERGAAAGARRAQVLTPVSLVLRRPAAVAKLVDARLQVPWGQPRGGSSPLSRMPGRRGRSRPAKLADGWSPAAIV